jgi:hypothetical protein
MGALSVRTLVSMLTEGKRPGRQTQILLDCEIVPGSTMAPPRGK